MSFVTATDIFQNYGDRPILERVNVVVEEGVFSTLQNGIVDEARLVEGITKEAQGGTILLVVHAHLLQEVGGAVELTLVHGHVSLYKEAVGRDVALGVDFGRLKA